MTTTDDADLREALQGSLAYLEAAKQALPLAAFRDRLIEMLGRELAKLDAPIASDDERASVGPAGGERIKDWEELRHTLAHLWNAVDHLVDGFPESAGAELQDCMANIFWNSTDEMRADLDGTQANESMLGGEQAADAPEAEVEEAKPPEVDE